MFGREAGEAEGADGGGEGKGRCYDGVGSVGLAAFVSLFMGFGLGFSSPVWAT